MASPPRARWYGPRTWRRAGRASCRRRPMPIGADGRFKLTGVVEGSKTFTLIVPQSPRCGFQFTLACSPVRVVADSTEITVALREHLGRVQGRVKCVNTQVPPQRLLVCA